MTVIRANAEHGGSGSIEPVVADEPQVVQKPVPFINREPVVIMAFIRAVIYLAVAYGFQISPEQMGAMIVAVESLLTLITRQQVTPFISAGTTPNVNNEDAPLVG